MTTETFTIVINDRGTVTVKRNLAQLGTAARRAQGGVQLLRRALGLLGGALILTNAIRTLAEFGQAMSTVKAITEATEDQFRMLSAEAERLGATTRFSATQAAEGLLFLARAGFDTAQALGAIEGTLQLAQAGALDLGRAADIASNILKGMRLEVSQTGRVVDVLAKAANSANTTVEQLGTAMKFVAPVASGLGVGLEEVTAAMAALSDAGLQASMAGTGLRRTLSELESPSGKTLRIFRSLKVSADEVRISQVGLIAAVQRLGEAGITTGQALEIFGDRGGPAFEVLSSSIPSVIKMRQKLIEAGDTAKDVAKIMDDNLNGALLAVKSGYEAMIIAMGKAGADNALTDSLNRLASLLRFVAGDVEFLTNALLILATVALAKLVIVILGSVIGAVASLAASLTALAVTVLPFLAVAAVVAFATIKALAFATGKTVSEVFDDIITEAKRVLEDFIGPILSDIFDPSEDIVEFNNRMSKMIEEVEALGGAAALTEDQLEVFLKRIQSLRNEVNQKLLLQEFLDPGSKGISILKTQVEDLDATIDLIRQRIAGTLGVEPAVPEPDPEPIIPTTIEFVDLIRDLKREGELLRLNNDDRAVRATLMQAEDALGKELNSTQKTSVEALVRQNLELERQADAYENIFGPQEAFAQGQRALDTLMQNGVITTRQFNREMRDLRLTFLETQRDFESGFERGLIRVEEQFTDFAALSEEVIVNAFQGAEDALVSFFTTGEVGFSQLVDSILADLTRLAVRQAITAPLAEALQLGGGDGGDGGGGGIGGFFKKLFKAGAKVASASSGDVSGGTLPTITDLAGGGSITIGGIPGVDQNLLSINNRPVANVSRGERIDVVPRGQSGGPGRVTKVVANFHGIRDMDSLRQNQGRIRSRMAAGISRAQRKSI